VWYSNCCKCFCFEKKKKKCILKKKKKRIIETETEKKMTMKYCLEMWNVGGE
jgi:hypothetical protein